MIKRIVSALAVFGMLISLCGCLNNNRVNSNNQSVKPDFKSAFELQCQYGDNIYDFFGDFSDDGVLSLSAAGILPPALENTSLVLDGKTVNISSGDIDAALSFNQLPEDFIPKLIFDFISFLSSDDFSAHFEKIDGRYFCSKIIGTKTLTLSFPCDMTDKTVYLLDIN